MRNKLLRKKPNRFLQGRNNYFDFGSTMNRLAGNPTNGKLTTGFLKDMTTENANWLASGIQTAGQVGGGLIGGGMSSGVGNALQGLGSIASAIPGPYGAMASAALNVAGGITNKLFGSQLNKENIAKVESNINNLNSFQSDASDFDSLASNYANATTGMTFDDSFIGKDGIFSNKAKKKAQSLRNQVEAGNAWVQNSLANNTDNLRNQQAQNLLSNYTAFGGYLFRDGGDINYDETLSGRLTNYAENPDSVGYNSTTSRWYAPNKKGYDKNNRGMGVDINTNPRIKNKLKTDTVNNETYLTEEDERVLRHASMGDAEKSYTKRLSYANDTILGKDRNHSIVPSQLKKSLIKDLIYYRGAGHVARKPFNDNSFMETFLNGSDQELYDKVKKHHKDKTRAVRMTKFLNANGYPDIKAFGGELNTQGSDFTNGLLYIDNGGSHEQNPYEGVLMGVDPEGVPNLVEEGETVFNDYVFSKRLKVPKAIRSKYKLRDNITFADASKKLAKESEERPNDPISKRGLEILMSDLASAQEQIRMKKESNVNKFDQGGLLEALQREQAFRKKLAERSSLGLFDPIDFNSATPTELELPYSSINYGGDDDIIYKHMVRSSDGLDYELPEEYRYYNGTRNGRTWEKFAEGKFTRANEGKYEETIDPITGKKIRAYYYDSLKPEFTDRYHKMGEDGKYTEIFGDNPLLDIMNSGDYVEVKRSPNSTGGNDFYYDLKKKDKEYKELNTNLRYAPALSLGVASLTDALGLTNKPNYSSATAVLDAAKSAGTYQATKYRPNGNYLTYKAFDKNNAINKMNAEASAARRAILNTSGGNAATAMAGILAADNNYLNQLGALTRQAEEYDLAQRQQVEDFNRATNNANSTGFLQAAEANQKAQMAARETALKGIMAAAEMKDKERLLSEQAKSTNLSKFVTSLGNIGRENMGWNWRNFSLASGTVPTVRENQEQLLGNIGRAKGGKIKRKKGLTI